MVMWLKDEKGMPRSVLWVVEERVWHLDSVKGKAMQERMNGKIMRLKCEKGGERGREIPLILSG